ncbi:HNH endonuclease [Actinomycetospora endophytica]|uniref:HNH endonuclease n=1 Tax=Actinomycetospora endophytica TaxID=2291215 RepID=A0ABS8PAD2_9PSEU|nr:HNH endonuclease signature motif containing protein [Actinomycetospora endophytica]MCD2194887.1 HNH endonuclease [Actinomycetospora endophytica]
MSSSDVDEAMFARARAAMVAAREAEHAVLVAVGELAESGSWAGTGHRSLSRFLSELWRINDGHARRLVRHAAAVLPTVALSGEALGERMPSSAAASGAGEIGDEHLTVLTKAVDAVERIPEITADQVASAEAILGEAARALTPGGLEKAVSRLLETLDQDGAAPDDGTGDTPDEWQLVKRKDGTLTFTGRIHGAADVALLLETVDALSGPAGPDDKRPLAVRRAEALLDLCAHALGCAGFDDLDDAYGKDVDRDDAYDDGAGDDADRDAAATSDSDEPTGTDEAGSRDAESDGTGPTRSAEPRGGEPADDAESDDESDDDEWGDGRLRLVPEPEADPPPDPAPPRRRRAPRLPIPARATLSVTIPLEWLREQRGHMLIDDAPADVAAARRLACDAKIIPAVLGSRGEPLDIGRAAYAVPPAIWRALLLRDRGCAHPGCRRRASRTHAHHIWHWIDDGPTSLENTVLLCRYHHQLVHHGDWQITTIDGRPWFTPPRWVDPERQPIPGGPLLPAARPDAA